MSNRRCFIGSPKAFFSQTQVERFISFWQISGQLCGWRLFTSEAWADCAHIFTQASSSVYAEGYHQRSAAISALLVRRCSLWHPLMQTDVHLVSTSIWMLTCSVSIQAVTSELPSIVDEEAKFKMIENKPWLTFREIDMKWAVGTQLKCPSLVTAWAWRMIVESILLEGGRGRFYRAVHSPVLPALIWDAAYVERGMHSNHKCLQIIRQIISQKEFRQRGGANTLRAHKSLWNTPKRPHLSVREMLSERSLIGGGEKMKLIHV